MFTKFGEGWSNSEEMATVFRNSAILNLDQCATFRHDICILHRIRNILTNLVRIGLIVMN